MTRRTKRSVTVADCILKSTQRRLLHSPFPPRPGLNVAVIVGLFGADPLSPSSVLPLTTLAKKLYLAIVCAGVQKMHESEHKLIDILHVLTERTQLSTPLFLLMLAASGNRATVNFPLARRRQILLAATSCCIIAPPRLSLSSPPNQPCIWDWHCGLELSKVV